MNIVAIDPSVNEVGWARITGLKQRKDGTWDDSKSVWKWGVWKIGSGDFIFKLKEIVEWMILEFDGMSEEDHLVAEWPVFFDDMRGHVAAKQNFTLPLAGIDCYIAGYFRLPWQNIHFPTPGEWKGNISKEITKLRFFRELGVRQIYKINHNAVDAAMILLSHCRKKRITMKIVKAAMEYLPDSSLDVST